MNRILVTIAPLALVVALTAAGCGADPVAQPPAQARVTSGCPAEWRAGWQKLADRIDAPVYCPSWMPDPLEGKITGHGDYVLSVDRDRSYLASFTWVEPQSGEIHVNLRGYPGKTAIPTCTTTERNGGKVRRSTLPCFSDRRGTVHAGAIGAAVYTVNRDADLWHVLYAWRHAGSLYTVSEHVAIPLTYRKVVANLNHMLRSLQLVEPHGQ